MNQRKIYLFIFCTAVMAALGGLLLMKKEEFEIPLTEDLMREHGILNRTLLIYEEIIRRIDTNQLLNKGEAQWNHAPVSLGC